MVHRNDLLQAYNYNGNCKILYLQESVYKKCLFVSLATKQIKFLKSLIEHIPFFNQPINFICSLTKDDSVTTVNQSGWFESRCYATGPDSDRMNRMDLLHQDIIKSHKQDIVYQDCFHLIHSNRKSMLSMVKVKLARTISMLQFLLNL